MESQDSLKIAVDTLGHIIAQERDKLGWLLVKRCIILDPNLENKDIDPDILFSPIVDIFQGKMDIEYIRLLLDNDFQLFGDLVFCPIVKIEKIKNFGEGEQGMKQLEDIAIEYDLPLNCMMSYREIEEELKRRKNR